MSRDAGALIRSLLVLRKERRTGVLEVTAEAVRTSIFLMHGSMIYAEEEPNLETLGRLLVRQGRITSAQYATTLENMADTLDDDEPLRFGAAAIALGFIDGEALNDALVEQARWRLVRAFQRTDHEWRLDDRFERVEGAPLYDLPVEPAVLLAMRSSPDEDLRSGPAPAHLAGRAASFPILCGDAGAIASAFALGPSERAYVAEIDGTKSIAECLRMGSALVDRTAILSALLLTRSIKLLDRPSGRDEEPPPSSRAPEIPVATAPAPANTAPKSSSAQQPNRGDTKVAHAARVNAELAFQKALALLRAGRLQEALADFRRAHRLDPTPEIELHVQWCEIEATQRPLVDAHREALQKLALAVSRSKPESALAAYVIGRVAALEGRDGDSKRWIERAYRLDPKLRDAARERALLAGDVDEQKDASSKRGLLGWLRREK